MLRFLEKLTTNVMIFTPKNITQHSKKKIAIYVYTHFCTNFQVHFLDYLVLHSYKIRPDKQYGAVLLLDIEFLSEMFDL